MKKRYTHVLFDLDGTVYDSYEANFLSFQAVMGRQYPQIKCEDQDFAPLFGVPGLKCLQAFGVPEDDCPRMMQLWIKEIVKYVSAVRLFPHILSVLEFFRQNGVKLGIITSRARSDAMAGTLGDPCPPELEPYFDFVVCASDVARPKPAPDSILKYMQLSGAKAAEILFVGDALTDWQCARSSGVDFALALWGAKFADHVRCEHYALTPYDLIMIAGGALQGEDEQWFKWARELQAIGQIGLAYSKNVFDKERFERLRDIACEIMCLKTLAQKEEVKGCFCFDRGYITPKIDTRAAVFNEEGKILMVKERQSGLWNMPGGWCEENSTIIKNTVKEVREEAGLSVHVTKLIAIVDRNAHNRPRLMYGALKTFCLCQMQKDPQPFLENSETLERGWFALDELPQNLRLDTNTPGQIAMCFEAYKHQDNWECVLE